MYSWFSCESANYIYMETTGIYEELKRIGIGIQLYNNVNTPWDEWGS